MVVYVLIQILNLSLVNGKMKFKFIFNDCARLTKRFNHKYVECMNYLKRSMRPWTKLRKLLCRVMAVSGSSAMLPNTYDTWAERRRRKGKKDKLVQQEQRTLTQLLYALTPTNSLDIYNKRFLKCWHQMITNH